MASFTLDTSTLSGGELETTDVIFAERGRLIQLSWAQAGVNQGMELLGYAIEFEPVETEAMAGQSSNFSTEDYAYIESIIEERGRSIQLSWALGGTNQDMDIMGHAIRYHVGETKAND